MVVTAAVDPTNLPKRMTKLQLEWWILFGICVAGKSAKGTEKKLRAFLDDIRSTMPGYEGVSPFEIVKHAIYYNTLNYYLRKHKLGKYKLYRKAFPAAVNIDLAHVSIESLEKIPGIGPKTARMTILYYEPEANCVPLDTHILKWLKLQGYNAPKSTPQAGRRYLELEQAFIAEAKKRGKTVRELDTEVWQSYRI
jgi:thermostable 8-oxoguanine DNA glycosylase